MLDKLKLNKKEEQVPSIIPNANIYQKENDVVVAIEMPGVDKSKLDVNLEGNELTIKGRKKKEEVGKEYTAVHQERQAVEYSRTYELNSEIDRESIQAEFKNGVLKVSLAKSKAAQPKKISIQT